MFRIFMCLLAGLFCLQACGPASRDTSSASRPNIILILTDDQGWGDLGLHGNANLRTPNLDRLGREGLQFQHFYVSAVCSPTRAELLTGRHAVRGGVYSTSAGGERLDLDEVTLPQLLQAAGYRTGAFGKWHNGMQYPYHPNGRGFDEFYGFCSGHWGNYLSPMLEYNGQIVRGEGFLPDDLTNRAIEFMAADGEEPFFLYLPYPTPHSPMQMPDSVWEPLARRPMRAYHRETEREDTIFTQAALALVENIDQNVGRLLAALEQQGKAKETLVIFLSDNGPNSWRWNGGMKGRKGSVDEGGVRAPLLMCWPGHWPGGSKISQITTVRDLLPTLSEVVGMTLPDSLALDGRSLLPLIQGDSASWPERTLVNHWRGRTSVRSQRFRLDPDGQLFDMLADPGQHCDVAAAHPAVFARLQQAQEAFTLGPLTELPAEDQRPFPVGHPDYDDWQLPARDAIATGEIQRSNRWPNCSFYTNWTRLQDSIYWDLQVEAADTFTVTVYLTCAEDNVGAQFELCWQDQVLPFTIAQAHDPPLRGGEQDRVPREESLVKDFLPMAIGAIPLTPGTGRLRLVAKEAAGPGLIDVRLLMLSRYRP